ncbi:MAG TPA: hypothetical protein VF549_08420 [Solirubrobacteraceae bacterium]
MTVLDRVAAARAFRSVHTPPELVGMYVSSAQLSGASGGERPETRLYEALTADTPQRVHVIGESGAGKTGMILKVVGDLSVRELERPYETLIVNVGANPEQLHSGMEFLRAIVQQIARQGHRFASVDPGDLAAAAADQRTRTGTAVEHRAGVGAVVNYQVTIKEVVEAGTTSDNAAQARQDFEDVLKEVSKGYRPLIVIDDTEHFVSGVDGKLDVETVTNLYDHAIRALAGFAVDVIVAMHPHYQQVAAVTDVIERFGFLSIPVAALPAPASDTSALEAILQRRIDRHAIGARVGDVVSAQALAQLSALYFTSAHNLRTVLNVADEAAVVAAAAGATTIGPQHVQPILDSMAGTGAGGAPAA